jgi:hypothetical protein
MRRFRAEQLLPLACAGGAAMLAASQFMDIFKIESAPGQTFDLISASDQHWFAMLVLAVFAIAAVLMAVSVGSKAWASAVAVAGGVALLLFLLIDLPDAGRVGDLGNENQFLFQAKANPSAGFWMELAGSLILAICGGALATLSPDQLRALPGSWGGGKGADRPPTKPAGTEPKPAKANPGGTTAQGSELPRKPSGTRD